MIYQCFDCNRTFASAGARKSHSRATGHDIPNCGLCDRMFVDQQALMQHTRAVHTYCAPSQKLFGRSTAFQQYANSSAHQLVPVIESAAYLDDAEAETYCYSCKRSFINNAVLNNHLAYSSIHNWCFVCSRDFVSAEALAKHNASPVHNGKTFKCPFCTHMFKTPSSIAMHIESGCHRISRHQVTAAVHQLKIIPEISLRRRIEGPPQVVSWSANENAFNGYAYECYLCHSTFKTLDRLNQHLQSPAHDESEFRCPHCNSEFKLVSGLVQHIESESCGIARFQDVTRHFDSLTERFSRLLRF